jgi:hypothetical protein
MPLLHGSIQCVRYNLLFCPEHPDFESLAFEPIPPMSALKERSGFIPFVPEHAYELGPGRFAFRVRKDTVKIDSTRLKERIQDLLRREEAEVGFPNLKRKKEIRQMVEEELLRETTPRCKIIECYVDGNILFLGSTSHADQDLVTNLMKKIGFECEPKTPWGDRNQELDCHWLPSKHPSHSLLGCIFARKLLNHPDIFLEPEKGSVRMVIPNGTQIGLSGPVVEEVDRLLVQGAEILKEKILFGSGETITFDALDFSISGLKTERFRSDTWQEQLEQRIDAIAALFDRLDHQYEQLMVDEVQTP